VEDHWSHAASISNVKEKRVNLSELQSSEGSAEKEFRTLYVSLNAIEIRRAGRTLLFYKKGTPDKRRSFFNTKGEGGESIGGFNSAYL